MISVSIMNVGGSVYVEENLTPKSVTWETPMDTIGSAVITFDSCDTDVLEKIHPYVHELRITDGDEVVFVGPVYDVQLPFSSNSDATLTARTMPEWFNARFTNYDRDYTGTSSHVDDVVFDVVSHALQLRDPNLLPFIRINNCDTIHERKVTSKSQAWYHLKDMIPTLMHMTTFGRSIIFWCKSDYCIGVLPDVHVSDFKSFPNLVRDGEAFATEASFTGKDDVVASAGGPHTTWPILVQRAHVDESFIGTASVQAAANNAIRKTAPFTNADNDELVAETTCDTPWKMSRVHPGMCVTVTTRYGRIRLQVTKLRGQLSAGAVKYFIHFREP